jgi:hypothetical protein
VLELISIDIERERCKTIAIRGDPERCNNRNAYKGLENHK